MIKIESRTAINNNVNQGFSIIQSNHTLQTTRYYEQFSLSLEKVHTFSLNSIVCRNKPLLLEGIQSTACRCSQRYMYSTPDTMACRHQFQTIFSHRNSYADNGFD